MNRFIILILSAFLFPGCLSAPLHQENRSSAGIVSDGYVDSAAFVKLLTDELVKAHEKGRAPIVGQLVEQLSRKHCSLSLPSPSNKELTPVETYERLKKSVLLVASIYKCSKCNKWHASTASGFFLTKSGIMVTNYHVVDQSEHAAMGAITYDGKIYLAKEVLAANEDDDVAIIKLDNPGLEPLALATRTPVGSAISLISHPGERAYSFTRGIVSGYFINKEGKTEHKVRRMSVTADYGGGSSGAPILDEYGNVSGIVASTQPVFSGKGCEHDYAQMIFKDCIPAEAISALVKDAGARK
jgi:S1-C subfamily serine protease